MYNPFVCKLECFAPLSVVNRRKIEPITLSVVPFRAYENVIREGDEPNAVNIVMSGWAQRYKVLPDGRRQIMSLFLPGDMCDPYVFLLGAVDHAIGTLTPCSLAKVSAQNIRKLMASGLRLAEAL